MAKSYQSENLSHGNIFSRSSTTFAARNQSRYGLSKLAALEFNLNPEI